MYEMNVSVLLIWRLHFKPISCEKKSKVYHVHTNVACSGGRGIVPLILNLGTRWK